MQDLPATLSTKLKEEDLAKHFLVGTEFAPPEEGADDSGKDPSQRRALATRPTAYAPSSLCTSSLTHDRRHTGPAEWGT